MKKLILSPHVKIASYNLAEIPDEDKIVAGEILPPNEEDGIKNMFVNYASHNSAVVCKNYTILSRGNIIIRDDKTGETFELQDSNKLDRETTYICGKYAYVGAFTGEVFQFDIAAGECLRVFYYISCPIKYIYADDKLLYFMYNSRNDIMIYDIETLTLIENCREFSYDPNEVVFAGFKFWRDSGRDLIECMDVIRRIFIKAGCENVRDICALGAYFYAVIDGKLLRTDTAGRRMEILCKCNVSAAKENGGKIYVQKGSAEIDVYGAITYNNMRKVFGDASPNERWSILFVAWMLRQIGLPKELLPIFLAELS